MADAVLEVEAKIHDDISNALKAIQGEMRRLEHTSYESFSKMEKQVASLDKKANGASDAIVGSMKRMAAGVVAAAGSYFAFNKIASILDSSVQAARDQVMADKDLQASLQSTGHAAGVTFDELTKMASGLQKVTNFQDDAIQRAQGMLLTFTKIGKEVFPEATEATLNMAAKFKTDASQAAVQLGKALNDPIVGLTTLRRVGVAFTEQQRAQIEQMTKAGDILGAQKIILAELATEFGGLARATADPMTQFKNALGEVQEEIGLAVLPVLNDLSKKVLEVIENAKKSGDMDKFLKSLTTMAGVAQGAAESVLSLANAVLKFNEFIEKSPAGEDAMKKQERFYDERLQAITGIDIAAKKAQEAVHKMWVEQALAEEKAKGFGMPGLGASKKNEGPKVLTDEQKKDALELAEFQSKLREEDAAKQAKMQKQIREAARKEREEAVKADEKYTQQIYEARQRAQMAEAGTNEMDQLKAKQAAELEAYSGNEAAITEIKRAHLLERETLEAAMREKAKRDENELTDAKIAASARFANAMVGVIKLIGKENKAAARAAAFIAELSAIASTAAGIMKAYEQGGVLGFLTGSAIAAEGAVQIAAIESAASKFAVGTLSAPGGMAWVGERGPELMEVPRGSRIYNNTESRQMMGGGFTHSGPVNINISLPAGATPAQARELGDAAATGYRERLQEWKRMERDASYLGVTA